MTIKSHSPPEYKITYNIEYIFNPALPVIIPISVASFTGFPSFAAFAASAAASLSHPKRSANTKISSLFGSDEFSRTFPTES